MASPEARRGEVWLAALGAAKAGELGKHRPVVVLSVDQSVTGAADELVIIVPLSASRAPSPLRPAVPAQGGLDRDSVAVPRAARAIARSRLVKRLATLPPATTDRIARFLAALVGAGPQTPG
jgi:mRNA interferase MazF